MYITRNLGPNDRNIEERHAGFEPHRISLTWLYRFATKTRSSRDIQYYKYSRSSRTRHDIRFNQVTYDLNTNQVMELRRYLAIVPYQTATDSASVLATLANAAVLLFWLGVAALFAALRLAIHRRRRPQTADTFFACLAAVLGNSMRGNAVVVVVVVVDGASAATDAWLSFVMGVFATLASMLFTGALFEQLIGSEAPPQMDTMAELIDSALPIHECWGDPFNYN